MATENKRKHSKHLSHDSQVQSFDLWTLAFARKKCNMAPSSIFEALFPGATSPQHLSTSDLPTATTLHVQLKDYSCWAVAESEMKYIPCAKTYAANISPLLSNIFAKGISAHCVGESFVAKLILRAYESTREVWEIMLQTCTDPMTRVFLSRQLVVTFSEKDRIVKQAKRLPFWLLTNKLDVEYIEESAYDQCQLFEAQIKDLDPYKVHCSNNSNNNNNNKNNSDSTTGTKKPIDVDSAPPVVDSELSIIFEKIRHGVSLRLYLDYVLHDRTGYSMPMPMI
ncbi:MAG: hypothetical protein Q9162_000077 [Coniocarpon cinnabarinum]